MLLNRFRTAKRFLVVLPLSLVLTEALSALTALSALASAINAIMSTCFNSAHDALNAFSAVPELSKLFDNF